jgi:hypothetical protein
MAGTLQKGDEIRSPLPQNFLRLLYRPPSVRQNDNQPLGVAKMELCLHIHLPLKISVPVHKASGSLAEQINSPRKILEDLRAEVLEFGSVD